MATDLYKPFKRRSSITRRDGGKQRRIVLTLYPAGFIGLRLEGTRREETMTIDALYDAAVRGRVFRERMEKAKARKVKRKR